MKRLIRRFMPQTILLVLVAVFAVAAVSVFADTNDKVDLSLVMTPETQLTVYVDGALSGELSREYGFGDTATVNASATSGSKRFSHWVADGSVISYDNPLKLTMNAHTTLYAVYADVAETEKPVSGFTSITRTNEGDKISFQAIAGGGTVQGAGIVYSTTASGETLMIGKPGVEDVAAVQITESTTGNKLPDSILDENKCWVLQMEPESRSTVYHARTYVKIGEETTYGDIKDVKLSDLESGISLVADPDSMNPEDGQDVDSQDIKSLLANVKVYSVTFDANGGTGTMDPQGILGGEAAALNKNTFTRSGYTFSGWSTTKAGSVAYTDGASVTLNADTTLYAQWKKSGGSGGTAPGESSGISGKTTPAKPSAPTLESKTDTTITVKAVSGQEYSIDGGKTWQKSGTFTGLTPETEYSIVTKITETDAAYESEVSDALKVATDKKAASSGTAPGGSGNPSQVVVKPTEQPTDATAPTTTPDGTAAPTATPDGTAAPTGTPGSTAAPAGKVTAAEKAKAKVKLNAALKVSQAGKKVTVKWGKVSKADRYVVYAAYCGKGKCKKVGTLSGKKTSLTFTKLDGKKLDQKKNIKVYVLAYRKVDGKETKLAKSITAYIAGSANPKYTNVKKIKLTKTKYTLKAKKTAKIGAKLILADKNKELLPDGYAAPLRYATGNAKVAKVGKDGTITAVKKGTCYVYVYARNGLTKKVKVVVK